MALLDWSPELELGLAPMDATHREFVALLNTLNDGSDADLARLLEEFIAHTVVHFEQENDWMQRSGFPPVGCHMGEHERVLDLMRQVLAMVKAGQPAAGRILIAELPAWFANHAATMDNALAWFITQTGFDVNAGRPPAHACGCGRDHAHTAAA
jgi:hemerythrin-like metal-binding protein